jgi:hypothetical protein
MKLVTVMAVKAVFKFILSIYYGPEILLPSVTA